MNQYTADVCKQVVDFLSPVVRNFDVPTVNDVFNNLSLIVHNDADDADALQELSVFVDIFYDVLVELLSPEPDAYAWEIIHHVNVEIGEENAW